MFVLQRPPVNHTIQSGYRPDIDGLRALAVLLVIGFHAFPEWVRAGFIGVDVFFVISGFLISSIIFTELQQNRFSFLHFYARRIRRIFPALILVLAICYAYGWFVLLTSEYATLGKHIAGGAGFLSNFILLRESGYFDEEAIRKPLLHLWSLGIEEQFYIVWPFLLWLAWRIRFNLFWMITLVASVSFVWNILPTLGIHLPLPSERVFWKPLFRTDAIAMFYLPQARFWELLMGSLLAYATLRHTLSPKRPDLQSFAGMALILLGVVFISREQFPGVWALLPTVGTVLIVSAGATSWLNRKVFSHPFLVNIGLISYPLYLWHWPLLSFATITAGEFPSVMLRCFLIVMAFILASLTYIWMEKPIRFSSIGKSKTLVLVIAMALIGSIGYYTFAKNGLESRAFALRTTLFTEATTDWNYPGNLIPVPVEGLERVDVNGIYTNMNRPPRIIFFGDSHMAQFGPRITTLTHDKKIPIMFMTGYGCLIIPHVVRDDYPHCTIIIDYFNTLLSGSSSVKTIVIGGNWSAYFLTNAVNRYRKDDIDISLLTEQGRTLALTSFQEFLRTLSKKYTVFVILDNPDMKAVNPRYLLKNRLTFEHSSDLPQAIALPPEQQKLNTQLRAIAIAGGARVIDQLPTLCPQDHCKTFTDSGEPIYEDSDHLTASFVAKHANYIDEVFASGKY